VNHKDELKTSYWQSHISEQEKSSVNITEYCKRSGISKDTFYRWRKKLSADRKFPAKTSHQKKIPSFSRAQVEQATAPFKDPSDEAFFDPRFLGTFAASFLRGLR
jgi:predicted DNA-binding transcriptional regulator AlpA